ncbi:type II 3-dehydroquinate dehydratase [Candidatus Kirkpatrickella diaphorinae]|uniref:3-dehydroquinate dehydratase n=1 Tax=Candidatus Kirkpatrickella diaphorinae TaxID=2984322 RepID=A0ABY6GIK2_9PROT|nr:type II 3-dehydroquinate dehydratase [Candidatus Kirkpatrickella diaphorinae]UYH50680.1 type II 3-dehydroquinate dehydratase [Candidatus Kirkpatrickella diaphorinae]
MTRLKIAVFNGPNLNLLGTRQPEVYGCATVDDVEQLCLQTAEELSDEDSDEDDVVQIDFRQTNNEGELVSWIQECRGQMNGIILNPAAFGHTSIALLDALLAVDLPTVEVHITNIHQREAFRHQLYTAQAAIGVICGFGVRGYQMAIRALYDMFQDEDE